MTSYTNGHDKKDLQKKKEKLEKRPKKIPAVIRGGLTENRDVVLAAAVRVAAALFSGKETYECTKRGLLAQNLFTYICLYLYQNVFTYIYTL